jgi:hypothetical protein
MIELETYWSGSLERQQRAPGLSGYQGSSQLVGGFEREDQPPQKAWRQAPGARVGNRSLDGKVRALLKAGVTPSQIAARLGCSPNVAYRVRRQGI